MRLGDRQCHIHMRQKKNKNIKQILYSLTNNTNPTNAAKTAFKDFRYKHHGIYKLYIYPSLPFQDTAGSLYPTI